jgi:hypothetical protein
LSKEIRQRPKINLKNLSLYHSINHIVISRDSKYQHTKLSKPFTSMCFCVILVVCPRERERKAMQRLTYGKYWERESALGEIRRHEETPPPPPPPRKKRKRDFDEAGEVVSGTHKMGHVKKN